MHILYVDDDECALQLAKRNFCDIDKNIILETSNSARRGLDLLKEHQFDAVLSDYQMPEVDGMEFLENIRNEKIDIPFILFTGKGREEVAMDAINLGADGYFMKGFDDPGSQYGLLAKELKGKIELYKSKQALMKSEYEKSLILEHISESVSLLDRDLKIIWTNRSDIKFTDKPQDELIGKLCYKIWFKGADMCENCPAHSAMKTKEIAKSILVTSDRSLWLFKGVPVFNNNKEVIGAIETATNLTEMNNIYADATNGRLPLLKQKVPG